MSKDVTLFQQQIGGDGGTKLSIVQCGTVCEVTLNGFESDIKELVDHIKWKFAEMDKKFQNPPCGCE